MNLTTQEIIQFRLIKKMAVILMVIFRLGRPVGPNEISEILEIDRHTASKYMKSALSLGLLTRPNYHEGYTLTIDGKQLILGEPLAGISPVLPTTTVNKTLKDSNNLQSINQDKVIAEVVDIDWRENPHYEANVQALKNAGIGEPSRSKLANLEHVTPEYILAHSELVKKENKNTGMLVHRIREGDPAPEINNLGTELFTCSCGRVSTKETCEDCIGS